MTLHHLKCEGYWVNMAQDVEKHCRECQICQHSKLTLPSKAPLVSTPIENPWQMIAVDILTVPVSTQGNKYLLVVRAGATILQVVRLNLCHHCQTYTLE